MEELLSKYSLSDIIIFLIILVLAIKEALSLKDWFKEKFNKYTRKEYNNKKEKEKLQENIDDLNKFYNEKEIVDKGFEKINRQLEMLIESDREAIKSYITEQHHLFVYEKGWVDDYSLDCLEKRYAIYEKENGNTFVLGLMNEIRSLPKIPPNGTERNDIQ